MMTTETVSIVDVFFTDAEVRLGHLERLCRREKTTEVLSNDELALVQRFLYFNVNVTASGFRQRLITCVKYLLIQLKYSGYSIWRQSDPSCTESSAERTVVLKSYEGFIEWLIKFSFYCLSLRGCYARRAAALYILDLVYGPLLRDDIRNAYIDTWQLGGHCTQEHAVTLVDTLADSYETNQTLALKLLRIVPEHAVSGLEFSSLLETAFTWCTFTKTHFPETALYYFLFAVSRSDLGRILSTVTGRNEKLNQHCSNVEFASLKDRNCFLLCCRLLEMLQSRTDAAEENLIQASVEGPPWGLARTILYILKEVNWTFGLTHQDAYLSWRLIVEQLMILCHRLSKIVAPVVNSISPEGYLPMDNTPADFESLGINKDTSHQATCQAVLVCCWRTQKEISSIFGYLASLHRPPVLTFDQLVSVGDYFLVQLTQCKHRGAFECAYAAFADMCGMVRKSADQGVRELPSGWLKTIMDGLVDMAEGNEGSSGVNYCATRRSAGVPYLVQAVLASEPAASTLFYDTVRKLLEIMFRDKNGKREEEATAKVHSLNIVRALLKESKLGASFLNPPWLSLIAQCNLTLFTHASWAVRNSATLLFSAWMLRVFGVPRKREEISAKNKMSYTDFDSLCPDLLDFLLQQLHQFKETREKRATAQFQDLILFPILSILARLRPSCQLRPFLPYLLDISLHSPVVNVRRSAASALCSVMEQSTMIDLIKKLWRKMADVRDAPQNAIHGILLLTEYACAVNSDIVKDVKLFDKDGLVRLCSLNMAVITRIPFDDANMKQLDKFIPILFARDCDQLRKPELCSHLMYKALTWQLTAYNDTVDVMKLYNIDNGQQETFWCVFYKQWRSSYRKWGSSRRLMEMARWACRTVNLWDHVTGSHGRVRLRKEACKFGLCIDPSWYCPKYQDDDYENPMYELISLYQTSSEGVIRRRFLQLACHISAHVSNKERNRQLMVMLNEASKPERALDDRLMVVDCLNRLYNGCTSNDTVAVSVILLRLLTDVEDAIREETVRLCPANLLQQCCVFQPSVALFIRVISLISETAAGKDAFCEYLLEIADELYQTTEDNSSEERVFIKNESNYNLEPVLLAEWLRLVKFVGRRMEDTEILEVMDSCVRAVDGLNYEQIESQWQTQCKETLCCRLLRQAVAKHSGNEGQVGRQKKDIDR